MESATTHLELAIEVDSDPIAGEVSNGSRRSQPFKGWIELVAAIEAARSSASILGGERQTLGLLPGAKAAEL